MLEKILFPQKKIFSPLENKINNKIILITGATFGIGEKTVYKLAKKNVTLILVARTFEKLKLIKLDLEKKGAKVYIFQCNLYDLNDLEKLIFQIRDLNLEIDIFINNAGKSICRSLDDSLDSFHDFTITMNINYFSPVRIILEIHGDLYNRNKQVISA